MIKVALIEPEIPQNTGNIARLCAGTSTELILVGKLGFSLQDKYLKRAGLDYWEFVNLRTIDSIDDFFINYPNSNYEYAFLSKFADNDYTNISSSNSKKDLILIFGNETSGLPEKIHKKFFNYFYKIPMNDNIRSLNLSNSVAIVLYDVLRRNNFNDL